MSEPISQLTEYAANAAAQSAIKKLEGNRVADALRILRKALSRRDPGDSTLRLRAYTEQAIRELEVGDSASALVTLHRAVKSEPR
jgi:predicted negative regulator of RcsB-dependent stress response